MTGLGELAELPHPELVAQLRAPLGEPDRAPLTRGQAYLGGKKLLLWPILPREFVIAQAGDTPLLHLGEKVRAVAFTIEHDGKAMKVRIGVELFGAGLVRHILLETRNDVVFEDLQHSRIDRLADHKERLAIHSVDPVIRRRTQAQALTG